MRRLRNGLLMVALLSFLAACGAGTPTIYDLVETPAAYNGKEITAQGVYVWRPGDPGVSVLSSGVSTRDDGTDAQPLDQQVWLENFPAEASANLHRPVDGVYGAVEVTGRFESGGQFGPGGAYASRLVVSGAKVIEQIERTRQEAPRDALAGQVSVHDLAADGARFSGQRVTTRGFYFWTPATSGLLAVGVETEVAPGAAGGLNPQPLGQPIAMEGFPPDLSAKLNVGPANGFVWGLVEVSGTFESGGTYGVGGTRSSQLILDPASVKPIN